MVKRYAAAHFEHFFPVLSKDHIFTPVPGAEQSLMQMYISLATDSTQARRQGLRSFSLSPTTAGRVLLRPPKPQRRLGGGQLGSSRF